MRDTIVFLLVCIMLTFIFTGLNITKTCQAADITVGSGVEYDYNNIQDAIDAANTSDTITIYSGTYNENIVIDKSISLIANDGAGNTIINSADDSQYTVKVTENDVVISGFSIQNNLGKDNDYGCLYLYYASTCEIKNNIIKKGETGIYLIGSTENNIHDNTIETNDANGITLSYQSNNNQIAENTIENNVNNGVQFTSSSTNTINKNTIQNNFAKGVYLSSNSNNNVFYENTFNDNGLNAQDCCGNTWHLNSKGNTWDDYNNYDSNSDGIGDEPYTTGDVNDIYPLGVFINQKPTAVIDSISPNPSTQGEIISFRGHGIDDGSIVSWEWQANGNNIGLQEDLDYSSLTPGTYTIRYRVQDNDGDYSDWVSHTSSLVVSSSGGSQENNAPVATIIDINPESADYGQNISFSGQGHDEDAEDQIIEYFWSSNKDSFLSSQASFLKNDLSVGTHTIYFKVKDNHDTWSSVKSRTVVINSNPPDDNLEPIAVSDGPYYCYIGETITFDASDSYDPDGSISSYSWDFGDGNTQTGKIVEHTYTETGEMVVVLTVTDNYGVQDTEVTSATILIDPNNQDNNGNNGNNANNSNNEEEEDKSDKWVIPGFELLILIFAVFTLIIFRNKKDI